MPIRALPLLALALVLGTALVVSTRRAEGQDAEDGSARIAALEQRVASLAADVEVLRRRERATTEYLVGLTKTAANLHSATAEARREGFEMAAISSTSRILLLKGIDQLGSDLAKGVPAPTREDEALMRKADELRRNLK